MDAFLRRVVEQRELEQEAGILSTPVEALIRRCRLCGDRIGGDSARAGRVCTKCGGTKVHARLEREDAVRKARRLRLAGLVALAGFKPQPLESLMADRNCVKCGKKLHHRNSGDACLGCRDDDGGGQDAPARKARAKPDVIKRFRVVAAALDCDPDDLIAAFCEGWLARVKSSANFSSESDA